MSWSDELPKALTSAGSAKFVPLPSDAPAETIARLSSELAASQTQVARMGKGLKHLRAMYRFSAAPECLTEEDRGIIKADGWCDPKSTLTRIIEPALASTSVDIAVPRERYERMVQALWMGPELANVVAITATGGVQGPATCDEAVERFSFAMRRKNEILTAMDAAGKALEAAISEQTTTAMARPSRGE